MNELTQHDLDSLDAFYYTFIQNIKKEISISKSTLTETNTSLKEKIPQHQKISIKPSAHKIEPEVEAEKIHKEHFNQHNLHEKINEYVKTIPAHKEAWANTLLNYMPELKEEFTVSFIFNSDIQQDLLEKNKEGFIQFLKQHLKNDFIKFESEVVIVKKEILKTINPSERLEKMIEVNPKLAEFMNKLKLDL